MRASKDFGVSWNTPVKIAPPASPTHCIIPVMGLGVQLRANSPHHPGRMLYTGVHNSFEGAIVIYTDDGGATWGFSNSSNLIRIGIDESQLTQLPNSSLMIISRNCISSDGSGSTAGCHLLTNTDTPRARQISDRTFQPSYVHVRCLFCTIFIATPYKYSACSAQSSFQPLTCSAPWDVVGCVIASK
jgi:hypothetical protein